MPNSTNEDSVQDKTLDKANNDTDQEKLDAAHEVGAIAIRHSDQEDLEPGEILVDVVRKHFIGVVALFAQLIVGSLVLIGILILFLYSIFPNTSSDTKGLVISMAIFVISFYAIFNLIQIMVYRKSKIIVTNQSLVQVLQKAPFIKKVSRLSMSNVEDVSYSQSGILPSIFNYGTLNIQTAGEMENFIFTFCPKPDLYAHIIIEARQNYVLSHKEG